MDFIKDGLIVCNNEVKKHILNEIDKQNEFVSCSFITINQLKKKLLFDYTKKSIVYIVNKYNVNVESALSYLSSLDLVDCSKIYLDEKLIFLQDLKKDLINNNLQIDNKYFKMIIKKKKVVFLNIFETTEVLLLKNIIKEYTKVESVNLLTNSYVHDVYSFSHIIYEVNYVFEEIRKLLNNNIPFEKIKVCNCSSDYLSTVKRVSNHYNIKLNILDEGSIFSSSKLQDYLVKIKDFQYVMDIINNPIKDDYINNLIISIINDYEANNLTIKEFYKVLVYELKNAKYERFIYDNMIEVIDFNQSFLDDSYYIFYLGFNVDVPYIYKDEDYLSDFLKEKISKNTSKLLNEEYEYNLSIRISHYKNLIITYSRNLMTSEVLGSNFISKYNLNEVNISDDIYLNKEESNICLGILLDRYYTYNINDDLLDKYYYNNYAYDNFNNKYTGIDKSVYNKYKNDVVKLSYSSINKFYQCSFSYYVSKVLNLDIFVSNLAARLGTFAHEILRHAYDDDFVFEVQRDKLLKDVTDSKELYYFNVMAVVVEDAINFNKEYEKYSSFNKVLCEHEVNISYDEGRLIFNGIIDKIKYKELDEVISCAIIDYKTGNDVATLDNIEHGLNLQLVVYLYFLVKSNIFVNVDVVGFYLQRINKAIIKKDPKKDIIKQKNSKFRLDGYSINDITKLKEFSNMTDNNLYFSSTITNKNGSFSARAKVLEKEFLDKLVCRVDDLLMKAYHNINDANFLINPKLIDRKHSVCKYCKYDDICFMTYNDYIFIDSPKEYSNTEEED